MSLFFNIIMQDLRNDTCKGSLSQKIHGQENMQQLILGSTTLTVDSEVHMMNPKAVKIE